MDIGSLVKKSYRKVQNAYFVCKSMKQAKAQADMPTCFPEKADQRKSPAQMRKENVAHLKKHKEVNSFYMLYGLDIKGSDATPYIDYLSFMNTRNARNKVGQPDSQIVLLRDKYLFYKYLSSNGIAVAPVFALYKHGKLYNTQMASFDEEVLKEKTNYFIKSIDGECASYVKRIKDYDEYLRVREQLDPKQGYIFQDALVQCEQMNKLNPKSINTMRIATVMKNGEVSVLTLLLRVGTEKTGNVDNWAAGGLAVGIQDNGYLKQYGFYKPQYGQKADCHPDTGVIFSEFEIPFFKEAVELVCNAHKAFYGMHSIGWDVAFTVDGPMLIEGNDNWEISLQQACDRPLKKDWLDACDLLE